MSRILVVEDELLLVMLLEDMLADLGHEVVEVAHRLDKGLLIAEVGEIDAAILDVNLAGEQSFPIAEVLERRGIPFAFATGYGRKGLEERFENIQVVAKPFTAKQLQAMLAGLHL